MYKKPPSDDKHPGEETDDVSSVRPRYGAASRKPVANPQETFYADEHPEIPRIRRASLKHVRVGTLPGSDHSLDDGKQIRSPQREAEPRLRPASRRKRVEKVPVSDHSLDADPQVNPEDGETEPHTRTPERRRVEMLPFTGLETLEESPSDLTKLEQGTRRTSSSRRRRVSSRRGRHARPLFWGRRQSWLLIGLLALFLLVLAPILVGAVRNIAASQSNSSANTSAAVSISRLQSVPSNAHELIILPPDTSHPVPPVLATSAYLLDTDSETTLYAQNPYLHLPMLSTTKLMTATLAAESGKLDQQITITAAMEHDISQLSADSALFGVKQGQTYTLRDLLYGLLYVSGNDAALVIADALAGSVPKFVAQMNQKAQELGLRDTHFVNPHGLLDPEQYSCARDLAVLGQYSLSIPLIQQMSGGKTYHIAAGGKHDARVLLNENQFLWWYPGVTGGKTGYDGDTDFVQVMAVTRNNQHMIGVVMHTDNWWTDMRDLMDYGSVDYAWNSPRDVENAGDPIPYDNLWDYFSTDTQDVSVPAVDKGRYYVYTGYSVSGPVLAYFDKQGGLKKFGFPLAMPVPAGTTSMSQQFQHGSILCNFSTNQCSTI